MIYCNAEQVEFRNSTEFKAKRYFNGENEDVTEILPGDIIKIRPFISAVDWRADGKTVLVKEVVDGWIIPVPVNLPDFGG